MNSTKYRALIFLAVLVCLIRPVASEEVPRSSDSISFVGNSSISKYSLSKIKLRFDEKEGVLDKNKKLIPEINSETANNMIKDQSISGGMIPKINTCIDAVNNGVTGVVIVDGRRQNSLLFEIFSDNGAGTLIRK